MRSIQVCTVKRLVGLAASEPSQRRWSEIMQSASRP